MTDPIRHETLDEALYAIRQEVGPLTRNAEADTGKYTYQYVTLQALVEKLDPIAKAHGVVVRHQLNLDALRHELWFNGECREVYDIALPNPQGTAQGFGSAVTYLKRYDLTTTFGLVADLDDDGAAASVVPKPATPPAAPERRPSPVRIPSSAQDDGGVSRGTAQELDEEF